MLRSKLGFLLRAATVVSFVALPLVTAVPGLAQGRGGGPRIGKAGAPEDLTGYWVSIVTEDWRYRMVTPKKGDYASVPLNPEGRKMADTWDPAKDEAVGEQCKSYGAAAIMRVPGRIHLDWQDDMTLKVDMDAGTQTRLFHFAPPGQTLTATGAPSYQGFSVATWEAPPAPQGAAAPAGGAAAQSSGPGSVVEKPTTGGSLKVVTTHLKPGYLRKNGVPYSANATVTEYYTRTNESNGDSWLIVTTIVDDPMYLAQPFLTSTHFKKEANGAKFMPTACASR
jgi:hypothetical protein